MSRAPKRKKVDLCILFTFFSLATTSWNVNSHDLTFQFFCELVPTNSRDKVTSPLSPVLSFVWLLQWCFVLFCFGGRLLIAAITLSRAPAEEEKNVSS